MVVFLLLDGCNIYVGIGYNTIGVHCSCCFDMTADEDVMAIFFIFIQYTWHVIRDEKALIFYIGEFLEIEWQWY